MRVCVCAYIYYTSISISIVYWWLNARAQLMKTNEFNRQVQFFFFFKLFLFVVVAIAMNIFFLFSSKKHLLMGKKTTKTNFSNKYYARIVKMFQKPFCEEHKNSCLYFVVGCSLIVSWCRPKAIKNNICNIGNIIKLKIGSNFWEACIIFEMGVCVSRSIIILDRLDTDTHN